MNLSNRLLAMSLMILLTAQVALSQEKQSKSAEAPREDGLRKIASGSGNQEVEVYIVDEALEATIQASVENAMEIVNDVLQNLEINIEPIAIDVSTMDLDIDPIQIDVPHIDIDIDEVEGNDHEVDIDIYDDESHWNDENENREEALEDGDGNDDAMKNETMNRSSTTKNENEDKSTVKNKRNKNKDSSDENEKEKSKGLKKIN